MRLRAVRKRCKLGNLTHRHSYKPEATCAVSFPTNIRCTAAVLQPQAVPVELWQPVDEDPEAPDPGHVR